MSFATCVPSSLTDPVSDFGVVGLTASVIQGF